MDSPPARLLGLSIGVGLAGGAGDGAGVADAARHRPARPGRWLAPDCLGPVQGRAAASRKFEEQFPEAIELMARALRAGHALTTGLALVAEELPDPVGAEFRLVYDRQNFGMSMPDALRLFADRVPLLDARFFVTAVLTQRESGGNLAEILDNLATSSASVSASSGRSASSPRTPGCPGWVLALMPVVIALGMVVVAPDHILTLVRDPLGIQMAIGAGVLWLLGYFAIRRIVDVEY